MIATYRPISDPTVFRGGEPDVSAFNASWSDAMILLERELRLLGADDVIIEIDLDPSGFRLDGQPRADARAKSRRVRVVFEADAGLMSFAVDRFVRGPNATYIRHEPDPDRPGSKRAVRKNRMGEDWQHNLYAIAKGLEGLRMIDRYGVADLGQQYAGFKAITATAAGIGPEAAWEIVSLAAGVTVEQAKKYREVTWKQARKNSHPDVNDGDHTAWNRLQTAARVLGLGQ